MNFVLFLQIKNKNFFIKSLPPLIIIFVKGNYLRDLIELWIFITFFKYLFKILKIDSNSLVNYLNKDIGLIYCRLGYINNNLGIYFISEFNRVLYKVYKDLKNSS
jgi:hypothetical protein